MAMRRDDEGSTGAEAVVFWSWVVVLAGGLAAMISIPLSGQ